MKIKENHSYLYSDKFKIQINENKKKELLELVNHDKSDNEKQK